MKLLLVVKYNWYNTKYDSCVFYKLEKSRRSWPLEVKKGTRGMCHTWNKAIGHLFECSEEVVQTILMWSLDESVWCKKLSRRVNVQWNWNATDKERRRQTKEVCRWGSSSPDQLPVTLDKILTTRQYSNTIPPMEVELLETRQYS